MAAHHDHQHDHDHRSANARSLAIAALLTGGFMLAEVVGGVLSGSLALLADAGHMVTDMASLTLAWLGVHFSRRPPDEKRTYGWDRLSVLAAFVNGVTLFAIAAWIVVEAIRRLAIPSEVLGGPMLAIAATGLVVNVVVFLVLRQGERDNLNVRAAFLHVLGDLLGSVAAMVASLVILATGWTPVDPLLSVLVAAIILRAAWRVVGDSGRILMEATPRGFDRRAAIARLSELGGIASVSHLHAWAIDEQACMATLEAEVGPDVDPEAARTEIKRVLDEEFSIGHTTVEIRPPGYRANGGRRSSSAGSCAP